MDEVTMSDLSKMDQLYESFELAAKNHGLKAVAGAADKAYSTLANELSRVEGYKLGLSTALVVIAATGNVKPLKIMCNMFGFLPVPVPKRPWGGVRDLLRGSAEIAMGFAGVAEALALAMADGRITPEEKAQCRAKITELIEAVLRVDVWLSEEG